MAQEHTGRGTAQGTEALEESFLQSTFSCLGATGTFECVAKNLSCAAINDRNEDAPAVLAAMNESEVGSPALIRMVGDGARDLNPRPTSNDPLGKSPSFEFHEAVDFLAVDVEAIAEAQTAPGAAHATGGFVLVEQLDPGGEGFVDGPWFALPGLVVGGGARQSEPRTEAGKRNFLSRREELLLDLAHEFASGSGFPCISQAIL